MPALSAPPQTDTDVINTSAASLIDDEAMLQALVSGQGGARPPMIQLGSACTQLADHAPEDSSQPRTSVDTLRKARIEPPRPRWISY